MTATPIEMEAHPTKAIPHLPAANLEATRDWYERYLGFQAYEHLQDFLILERGAVVLHFYLSKKPGATEVGTLYLNVEGDIDALCARMRADGAVAENGAPTDQTYGKREFTARDPDGRPVFIGKPILSNAEGPGAGPPNSARSRPGGSVKSQNGQEIT